MFDEAGPETLLCRMFRKGDDAFTRADFQKAMGTGRKQTGSFRRENGMIVRPGGWNFLFSPEEFEKRRNADFYEPTHTEIEKFARAQYQSEEPACQDLCRFFRNTMEKREEESAELCRPACLCLCMG